MSCRFAGDVGKHGVGSRECVLRAMLGCESGAERADGWCAREREREVCAQCDDLQEVRCLGE